MGSFLFFFYFLLLKLCYLYPSFGQCCCIFRRCFCKFRNFITIFDFLFIILFILAWTFISLQIKEFRIMGLSINDSVYSSLFFFLTGLHFFHLLIGLFLLGLFFWGF